MRDASGEGRRRAIIEGVTPQVDGGRFPAKRVLGDEVVVEADVFTDGHDALMVRLLHAGDRDAAWTAVPMRPLGNDRWEGRFRVPELGRYRYTVEAWVDRFATWRRDLDKRVDAKQDVHVDLLVGAQLVAEAARRAADEDAVALERFAGVLGDEEVDPRVRIPEALSKALVTLMERHPDRSHATRFPKELLLVVDPPRARSSAWYEMFPRSASPVAGRHGTFADVEARLDRVAAMGFDVLYLPPIHPIGTTHRKGRNNAPAAEPGDVGSPWAIGSEDGGHKAVNPELGTLDDFRRLVASAGKQGIEVALDIAFQCSPDHPYVKEHPEWFRWRPDGTIQYAENPPKKYEDIYPFDFETESWPELWEELKSVFEFWVEQGVHIFRVDNPHTKPFAFWEWCIAELKGQHPDLVFLSEAFTRPRVMERLAKLGFTQSYTYFAWRNTKWELTEYFTELNRAPLRDYFRPNAWPNTPDILTEHLQHDGRPAFQTRLVLAATLAANYGIYGPAYELMEHVPREPGSEEYRDSEKYQLRHWDLDRPD
ncbi:MAG TPA: alpha-1,4-glucan--maltose-1-phosphate maltosyltransferase, partial [Acidimicrobiia bacterium]|nr:alpha-1,4-glucan--maltose-1-phosphate maltosyltransferase [Acidimicrobiia bacterium]